MFSSLVRPTAIRGGKFINRRAALAATALAMLVAAGCGGEKRVPTFPVTGTVKFKGQPVANAQVVLVPKIAADAPDRVVVQGTTADDGSFKVGSYQAGDGAPAGDYTVTVVWFKQLSPAQGGAAGPNVLPPQYATADTSPIKVTVGNGPTEIPPIDIK